MKKKINITDSGAEDIVSSMANSLEVPFSKEKNECGLVLPEFFGKGSVKGHGYDHGFGVVDANYVLAKDFHFQLEKGIVHPLKIVFNMGEDYKYRLEHEQKYKTLKTMETMIVASTPTNNHQFWIPAEMNTSLFSLEVNRKLFENRILDYVEAMDPALQELFRDVNGIVQFFFRTSMSYKISVMIEEFRNCQSNGMARRIYLEAKAYEIFASFIQLYLDEVRNVNNRSIFRHNHLMAIKGASNFIKANLSTSMITVDIAGKQGLSLNILQNGFRTLYNMSVNEYIQNERMLMAKKLLEEGELSISEITFAIGLNSKSYVSKLFGERFGMTPSEYRSKFVKKSG